MYEVFINNCPLVFVDKELNDNSFNIIYQKEINWSNIIELFEEKKYQKIAVVCYDVSISWNCFNSYFKKIIAGGGVVQNKNKELLFIFRNGKWDLPKGKLEKDENILECSIREVEEECGVNGLKVKTKLEKSFHMYFQNQWILKETNWYLMTTEFNGELKGQKEEGIQLVKWISDVEIDDCLQNTYSNIKKVIQNYYQIINQPL
jgi:ADP-ribose pyrophosphatase YjhB (NUDIX family)